MPAKNLKWSSVFGIMESGRQNLGIEDYLIIQNSIAQVVLAANGEGCY